MRLRVLPPVGEPIALGPKAEPPTYPGFHPVWTQSGTAALALGIQLAMQRRPDIRYPEVLLPAYGCPDLVAAAVYAGARPVLVDIGVEDPGYDLERLEQALSGNVVAVVAVNFLGIRERVETLAELAHRHDAWLIEDSAQWYPELASGEKNSLSPADAMVLSFGRGKPASLLGGGALLLKDSAKVVEAESRLQPPTSKPGILFTKIVVYNLLIKPIFYSWLTRVPGLGLGETRYKPLAGIHRMDASRLVLLKANAERYFRKNRLQETALAKAFTESSVDSVDLPCVLPARSGRLLRYPVLCRDQSERNRILKRATEQGLGATAMYVNALPDVADVKPHLYKQDAVPNARSFAARLITMPVHCQVTEADTRMLARLLPHPQGEGRVRE